MSLESVADDIREQARAEAEEIREAAAAEAEQLLQEAREEAEEILAAREREVDREIEQLKEQSVSSANLEAKQLTLSARREVLDEVREAVEARIAAIDGDERTELTASLLDSALAEFDDDEELFVHGAADDEELLQSLTDDDERLTVGEPVNALGGVVVEGTSTNVRVNNTFDAVVDDVWEDNLREISDTLFEE